MPRHIVIRTQAWCFKLLVRRVKMRYVYPAIAIICLACCFTVFRLYHVTSSSYLALVKKTRNKFMMQDKYSYLWTVNFSDPVVNILLKPPIEFLPQFKNPCWYDHVMTPDLYRGNDFVYSSAVRRAFAKLTWHWENKLAANNTVRRLRCLPYFFLAGQPKCGSTDLYKRIVEHPDIRQSPLKEVHWWTRNKLGWRFNYTKLLPFEEYVDVFDGAAISIEDTTDLSRPREKYHNAVVGDGSVSTFWDNDFWHRYPQNANRSEPEYLIAHDIHHLLPHSRIIVIFRNPTSRLYSDYVYFKKFNKSAEDFHTKVLEAVGVYNQCAQQNGWRSCAYNRKVAYSCGVRLRVGFYYIYLKDWLRVFPRNQIHTVRLEDYSKDPRKYLTNIYRFLDLRKLSYDEEKKIFNLKRANTRTVNDKLLGGMLQETKDVLDKFYRPFNELLAQLLQDKRYLWRENTTKQRSVLDTTLMI